MKFLAVPTYRSVCAETQGTMLRSLGIWCNTASSSCSRICSSSPLEASLLGCKHPVQLIAASTFTVCTDAMPRRCLGQILFDFCPAQGNPLTQHSCTGTRGCGSIFTFPFNPHETLRHSEEIWELGPIYATFRAFREQICEKVQMVKTGMIRF